MTCTTTSMLSRLTGTTASKLRGHRLALGCLLPGRPYAVCVEVRCSSRWAARRGTHRCRAGGRLICGRDWPGPSLAPLALVALVALVSFALLTVALLGLFPLALLPLAPIAAAPIRSGPVTGMPISLGPVTCMPISFAPVTCMPISFASITCMAIVFALLMVGARHDGRSNAGVAVACRAASRPMGCAAGGCPPR